MQWWSSREFPKRLNVPFFKRIYIFFYLQHFVNRKIKHEAKIHEYLM